MQPADSDPQDRPPDFPPPPAPPHPSPPLPPAPPAPPGGRAGYLPPPPVPDDGHVVPLRPYGPSELFTGAGRVLARAPRPLFCTSVLAALISIGIEIAAGPGLTTTSRPGEKNELHLHVVGFAASFTDLVAGLLVMAVTAQVTLSLVAGTLPDARHIYRRALRAFPLLIAILVVRVITVVVLGLFAVGVFLYVAWALAGYVLIAENARFVDAFRRSAELVRGSWWRVTGILLLLVLIAGGPSATIGFTIDQSDSSTLPWWGSVLIGQLIGVPLSVFTTAVGTLLYVDLRCRREGLAWKLDTARRGPQREPFGPGGIYASPPWRPASRR